MDSFLKKILILDRNTKRFIIITSDLFLCFFTLLLSFYIQLEEFISLKDIGLTPFLFTLGAIPIFWLSGLYKVLYHDANMFILKIITYSVTFYGVIFFVLISFYEFKSFPSSIFIIQSLLLLIFLTVSRILPRHLFSSIQKKK